LVIFVPFNHTNDMCDKQQLNQPSSLGSDTFHYVVMLNMFQWLLLCADTPHGALPHLTH